MMDEQKIDGNLRRLRRLRDEEPLEGREAVR
jgi:hypothetical protein